MGAGVAVAGADPLSPCTEDGAVVMEVDHDKQVVYTETLALALHEPDLLLAAMQPSEEHVAGRLTSPIVSTHLDTRNIAFERWGDRGDLGGPWQGELTRKVPCEGSHGGNHVQRGRKRLCKRASGVRGATPLRG